MEPIIFLKGLTIAFVMAIPIGPLGILCVRKTLVEGHSRGVVIGLAAATADSLYGSIAAFGLTFISDAITGQQCGLRLLGGGVLLVLGVRTILVKRADPMPRSATGGLLGSYLSALLLSFTNPMTVFAFLAVFAAFGVGQGLMISSACFLVLGVFAGSWLWFLTLGFLSSLFKNNLDSDALLWVDRLAGILIILSGVWAFASVI